MSAVISGNRISWPDGSCVRLSSNHRGKWVAIYKEGGFAQDEKFHMHYFNSAEEASEALAEIGQGPGGPT